MSNGSMNISIEDYAKLCANLKEINADAEKAIRRTISDFKSRAPGWINTAVSEEYTIKKTEVKQSMKGAKKRGSINVSGIQVDNIGLEYEGRRLTPIHFHMRPKKPSAKRDKNKRFIPGENITGFSGNVAAVNPIKAYQIKVEIHKGRWVTLQGKYDTTPYLSSNGGGAYLPFQRKGEERKPVVSIRSTSVPQMITNEKVSKDIQNRIEEGITKRLEHHVEQALKKK